MVDNIVLFFILQAFPESLIITFVCFKLLNLYIEWKKIFIIALLETLTNIIHFFPVAFGMHIVVLPLALAIYIRIFTKARLSKIFATVFLCLVVIAVIDGITTPPMLSLFNITFDEHRSSAVMRAIFSIPYYIALLLIPVVQKALEIRKNKKETQ